MEAIISSREFPFTLNRKGVRFFRVEGIIFIFGAGNNGKNFTCSLRNIEEYAILIKAGMALGDFYAGVRCAFRRIWPALPLQAQSFFRGFDVFAETFLEASIKRGDEEERGSSTWKVKVRR